MCAHNRTDRTLYLAAGHFPGATGARSSHGHREFDINCRLAWMVASELDNVHGRTLELLVPQPLAGKIQDVNDRSCNLEDLAVEIHCNAAPPGTQSGAYVLSYHKSEPSARAARAFHAQVRTLDTPIEWISPKTDYSIGRPDRLGWLRLTRCRALIVECGFLTHPEDLASLLDSAESSILASAIASGLAAAVHAD